jgi:CIC family chloride channel protein
MRVWSEAAASGALGEPEASGGPDAGLRAARRATARDRSRGAEPPERGLGASLHALARSRTPLARWTRSLGLATLVGWLAGLGAFAFASALHAAAPLLIGSVARPEASALLGGRIEILLLPALGALVSGLVVRTILGSFGGQGTDQLVHAFHHENGRLALPAPALKAAAAVGVISTGGSAGPEGPIAAVGAALGSSLGRALGLEPREVRALLVAGCAAGVGAVFGCPLGGALFATSVLYRQLAFEAPALVSAFVASAIGYSTFASLWGGHTRVVAHTEALAFSGAGELPLFVLLGLVCGATAILYGGCLRGAERAFTRLRLPAWSRPAVGGLATGAIACLAPQVMDGEFRVVQAVFDGRFFGAAPEGAWLGWACVLALVVVAKCAATGATVGSGSAGGVLGPSVAIGGLVGGAVGALLTALAPELVPEALRRALVPVGMASVLAASMRVPIAAMAMAMEMTGSFGLIVPLMLSAMTAYVVGQRSGIVASQVASPAESPAHAGDVVVSLLERYRVAEVMDRAWPHRALPATPLPAILASLPTGVRPVVPVVAGGRLVGIVSVAELRQLLEGFDAPAAVIAADLVSGPPPCLEPGDTLYEAVALFQERGLEAIPVVEDRASARYVGMLTRALVYEAIRGHLERMRESLLREHAGIAAIEEQSELVHLLGAMSSIETGSVERVPVGPELVGRSLREVDYRRTRGAEVLAIQTRERRFLCPPDPSRPLAEGDVLLVLGS